MSRANQIDTGGKHIFPGAAGLIEFDTDRVRSVLTKMGEYLGAYVDGFTPLDLPESSPTEK